MSTFEKIFEILYASAVIIWSCYLIIEVSTECKKMRWKYIISIVIMLSLTAFILAKLSW